MIKNFTNKNKKRKAITGANCTRKFCPDGYNKVLSPANKSPITPRTIVIAPTTSGIIKTIINAINKIIHFLSDARNLESTNLTAIYKIKATIIVANTSQIIYHIVASVI